MESGCCGCERKIPIKWEDSVGICEGEGDRRLRGMESGCCGCERKAPYKMAGQCWNT